MCWPVDNGHLGAPSPAVSHANTHSVAVTKDTRHAYVVSLGEDAVVRYELGQDGSLTHGSAAAAPPGSGPRHIVLNAAETSAFVVTEFSGEVLHYARDGATGELTLTSQQSIVDASAGLAHSRYGADPTAEHLIWGADVHLASNGRWAWASERSASTIATLPLGLSGEPEPATAFTPTEAQPRGFGVTPGGAVDDRDPVRDRRRRPADRPRPSGDGPRGQLGALRVADVLPIRSPGGSVSRCCARCIRPVAPAVWIAQARDWFDPCLRTARSLARSPGTGTSSMPRTLSLVASLRLPQPSCVASTSPRTRRTSTQATSSSWSTRRRSL